MEQHEFYRTRFKYTPPRSGRELLGRYTWLARLADKARADQAGTEGEYIAYCGTFRFSGALMQLGGNPREPRFLKSG